MNAAEVAAKIGQGRERKSGSGWMAPCPAHSDEKPSLSINDGNNGGVLLHCHANCLYDDIVVASGIPREEFAPHNDQRSHDDMWTPKGMAIAAYPYHDENGRVPYTIMKLPNKEFIPWRPDPTSPHGRAWNLRGVERIPYNLPAVLQGIREGRNIIICEGEKDADTLNGLGAVATTNPGGANKWPPQFAKWFVGGKLAVTPDQDRPGKANGQYVAASLHDVAAEMRVVDLPGLTGDKGNKDLTEWFDSGHDFVEFKRVVLETKLWTPTEQPAKVVEQSDYEPEWDVPRPLPTYREAAPFCSGVLGEVATAIARAVSLDTKTPIDFPSLAALGTCSAVIGGAVIVEVHETRHHPVNLYINLLAAPGTGKTPAMLRLTHPLDVVEQSRRERMEPIIREAEGRKRIAEARREKLEVAAAKAPFSAQLEAEADARAAREEAAQILVPAIPRLYTRDATPEALVALLADQKGRLAFVTDEGSEFYELAARYAATGKGNLGVYIDGKDGKRHVADRKSGGSTVIDRTTLTVLLFGQPIVLDSLAQDKQAKGRGLLARFLWAKPQSMVGWESTEECPTPRHLIDAWESLIVSLAKQAEAETEPVVLRMSPDAKRRFDEWVKEHRPRLRSNVGDLTSIAEWAAKLDGEVARLAGNLHALRTGSIHGAISDETMAAAIELAGYFIDHALVVFGEMEAPQSTKDAASVLRWIEARSLNLTTTRDIATSKDWEADRTRNALAVLVLHDYVQSVPVLDPSKPGRRSEQWYVTPKITAQNGAESTTERDIAPFCSVDSANRDLDDEPVVGAAWYVLGERIAGLPVNCPVLDEFTRRGWMVRNNLSRGEVAEAYRLIDEWEAAR